MCAKRCLRRNMKNHAVNGLCYIHIIMMYMLYIRHESYLFSILSPGIRSRYVNET